MNRVCTICARGGSKGVPNKNLTPLAGLPLIAHTILQAQASGLFDVIAVSSDSQAILDAAAAYGVTALIERPADLAGDHAPKEAAIRHCVAECERASQIRFDTIVDLDVTSPLRVVEDITGAVELGEQEGTSNVITGTPARRSPYFNLVEVDENGVVGLSKPPRSAVTRRQDSPKCYDMNASVYVWRRESLFSGEPLFQKKTKLFVMPEERSVDIDSPMDLKFVEFLMRERQGPSVG